MAVYLTVRKVRPDTVPYGTDIARGPWVWAVYDGETLVGVHATAKEARRKHSIWPQRSKEQQRIETYRRYHQYDPPKRKEGE